LISSGAAVSSAKSSSHSKITLKEYMSLLSARFNAWLMEVTGGHCPVKVNQELTID